MIGLFCRISSLLQGSFAKETYHFKEPTNRSHPITMSHAAYVNGNISPMIESRLLHMNESCHREYGPYSLAPDFDKLVGTHMKCVRWHKHEWVMAHLFMRHVSHTWMSNVTGSTDLTWRRRIPITMSHAACMNESYHTYERVMSLTYEWVVSERVMAHMNESWHTHEWVMAHTWTSLVSSIWMSHVTGSTDLTRWRRIPIWMSHGTHMNESWYTHEWVMAHTWMSHVTGSTNLTWRRRIPIMNESCRIHEWVMAHIWTSHVSYIRMSHVTGSSDLTWRRWFPHRCTRNCRSLIVTWHIQMFETWLVRMIDANYSHQVCCCIHAHTCAYT